MDCKGSSSFYSLSSKTQYLLKIKQNLTLNQDFITSIFKEHACQCDYQFGQNNNSIIMQFP